MTRPGDGSPGRFCCRLAGPPSPHWEAESAKPEARCVGGRDLGGNLARHPALPEDEGLTAPMRRLSFWLAVAGVSILANYAVEAAAPYAPPGLARFTAKLHQGAQ